MLLELTIRKLINCLQTSLPIDQKTFNQFCHPLLKNGCPKEKKNEIPIKKSWKPNKVSLSDFKLDDINQNYL